MSNYNPHTPIAYLKGVGPARAELMKKELGIATYNDLLNFFPHRYIDRTRFYKINEIPQNSSEVQIVGKIVGLKSVKQKRGSRLVATFADGTGQMELVWFRGAKWIKDSVKINEPYVIFGKTNFYNGTFSMPHPEMELVSAYKNKIRGAMQPVYSSTELLTNKGVSNKVVQNMMEQLFQELGARLQETLPKAIVEKYSFLSKIESLFNIHFPQSQEKLTKAQNRLKFEELFYIQLQLLRKKIIRETKIKGHPFTQVGEYFNRFYNEKLSFDLTGAQKRVLKEIRKDLASNAQMNRLLQGDVGSGKTIVALLTCLMAIDNGFQAAIMAPTEILATQHYNSIVEMLNGLDVNVRLLTGSTKTKARREIHEALEDGSLHLIIGTHALIEDKVKFDNLGIAIIDEQHRFGVEQRSKLWRKGSPSLTLPQGKGEQVRQKYMTANPALYTLLKEFQIEKKKQSTQAEQMLWEAVRAKKLRYKFRRQHIIGDFIADFVVLSKQLIIEIDGGYHNHPQQIEADNFRTEILNSYGFQVIRFTNEEVIADIDEVIKKITQVIESLPSGEVGGAPVPPHILVMTATPIPRTLAMSLYGDLDVSVIDELPPGRKEIVTAHRYDSNRLSVFKFLKEEIAKGRQVYIVYPLIQESEKMDYKDLMDGYESIVREFPVPQYQVSIVHGQMKPEDKDYEMNRFIKNETQIMVATTVIEVGVNVPNASVMVIESAERFGLSQLHQLRGRVGRGGEQSYCILMTGYKLSEEGKTRMETMVRTTDGFEVADVDLKLRGPGNIMGKQQSGVLNLRIADLTKDSNILSVARQAAIDLLQEDPELQSQENTIVRLTYDAIQKNASMWSNIS